MANFNLTAIGESARRADTGKATQSAVTGAIEAANEIGGDAAKTVRDALVSSVKGAKDVIKEMVH